MYKTIFSVGFQCLSGDREIFYNNEGQMCAYTKENFILIYKPTQNKFDILGPEYISVPADLTIHPWPKYLRIPGVGLSWSLNAPLYFQIKKIPKYHSIRMSDSPFSRFKELGTLFGEVDLQIYSSSEG